MDGPSWRATLLLVLGTVLVLGIVAKALLRRIDVPALVGYLAIGVALALADDAFLALPAEAHDALDVLADLGIVCLLFRVGLESDLRVLRRELPRATLVLVTNVGASFTLGALVSRWLGFSPVASLFVGVALSATSIAIAAYVWEGAGLLRSRTGALVIDVAELDDVAAVLMMVLLFAALPALTGTASLDGSLVTAVLDMLLRSVVFGAICWLFARFVERPMTASFRRLRHAPDPMLTLVGVAIVVAAFAAWLGFSLAVGALFAGLVFSRDPRAVRLEASFEPVHDLLAPFFFVSIGASLDLATLTTSLGVGAALLLAAVVGKVGGSLVPLVRSLGAGAALVVGVSMVPRAEIALFVVDQGRRSHPDLVPASIHGGMVLVVAVTCVATPPLLRRMIARHRDQLENASQHHRNTRSP